MRKGLGSLRGPVPGHAPGSVSAALFPMPVYFSEIQAARPSSSESNTREGEPERLPAGDARGGEAPRCSARGPARAVGEGDTGREEAGVTGWLGVRGCKQASMCDVFGVTHTCGKERGGEKEGGGGNGRGAKWQCKR